MSKRKGLSLEEKRKRMLDIFYEKKDVFQLKELEKLGPAEKGIVAQSVKDVVQSLVDDGYVDCEKIGTSSYFWAFPSKATQIRKRKLDQLSDKENEVQSKAEEITQETKRAKMSRNDSEERDQLIALTVKLKQEQEELKRLLEQYRDSDPTIIEKEKRDIDEAFEAANRWTDNIFALRSWLKNKFSMEESSVNKMFGIPDELDYVEEAP